LWLWLLGLAARALNRKYGIWAASPVENTPWGPNHAVRSIPGGMGRRDCHPVGPCTELWRRYGALEFRWGRLVCSTAASPGPWPGGGAAPTGDFRPAQVPIGTPGKLGPPAGIAAVI
jgi:hypothetical protein